MIKKKVKGIKFQDSGFFFDDCPICRAMKKAEDEGKDLTEGELKQVFREAKEKGALVGGSLLEPDLVKVN